MAEDEAVSALVSVGAEEVTEVAGSRIVIPVVFVGAAAEVAASAGESTVSVERGPVAGEPVAVGSPIGKVGPWGDRAGDTGR